MEVELPRPTAIDNIFVYLQRHYKYLRGCQVQSRRWVGALATK
ncbi:hypothetical protein CPAR01_11530 [Colletotrichum paranaense]|uniref:Uncharacterized protein n=1 Tax=Colletotrichum paranaense TaxID=1914294 RepID=A0ABQ9SD54_9PEZI|nr:uncharacterized protein CPAR01_11530 [Colletotrichum paranaense]KAK1531881.1 hypothetical protein CPAR01_11530 [Colletotrichum paranaense]